MNNNDNDSTLSDTEAQRAQSLLQTIQTVLPGLTTSTRKPSKSSTPDDEEHPDYGRTGKVARLPAAIRETVNVMLNDNVPYANIIEKLASLGYPGFSPTNISRWKQRGFVEWLYHRYQAESLVAAAKANLQLLKEITPEQQQALQKLVELNFVNQLLGALAEFNPNKFNIGDSAELLSTFGDTIARQFRERTRYERLLLAVRKFEKADAESKTSSQTP